VQVRHPAQLTLTFTNKFLFDRDQRGAPLEILIASHLHNLGLPVGYNPASGTDDPSREDYDLYVGQPDNSPLLVETKMDWQSGITGRIFVEEKTLRNTKASKFIVGRLLLDVFDTKTLIALYDAKDRIRNLDGGYFEQYVYKHTTGGDQANNMGMLLDWKVCKEHSTPFWRVAKELTQQQ
jgi:hypothetical protein